MTGDVLNLTCWAISTLGLVVYFISAFVQRRKQATAREFDRLQEPAQTFPGIVWGCKKWRRCGERLIQTPPYPGDDFSPFGPCQAHGLPMSTKVVERRVLS